MIDVDSIHLRVKSRPVAQWPSSPCCTVHNPSSAARFSSCDQNPARKRCGEARGKRGHFFFKKTTGNIKIVVSISMLGLVGAPVKRQTWLRHVSQIHFQDWSNLELDLQKMCQNAHAVKVANTTQRWHFYRGTVYSQTHICHAIEAKVRLRIGLLFLVVGNAKNETQMK